MKMPQMAREGKNQYGNPKPKSECDRCHEHLPANKFSYIKKENPSLGRRTICKACSSVRAEKERERRKSNWKYKPALAMLNNSKQRAKAAGILHSITIDDIIIPDVCPILGIKLEVGDRKNHNNAPSIDRVDNTKGYTKDNIMIVSCRANMLKKDATIDELIQMGKYFEHIFPRP
jgi:hypothetical protein